MSASGLSPKRSGASGFSSADLVAGGTFAGIGIAFGVGASGYDLGSTLDMGPGLFPLVAALTLIALGVAIMILAFRSPSREPLLDLEEPDEGQAAAVLGEGIDVAAEQVAAAPPRRFGALPWRAIGFVTAAIVWFAVTVEQLGFLPAAFGTVALASLARSRARWGQTLAIAAGLTLLSWLIFVFALGLRVPLIGPR